VFKHDYAEVNGIRLHYAMNGSGKLIMFVHGFPEFWYAWKEQLVEFGRDHCAVALDMRGYNLSDKPEAVDQYAIKYLTEDLRALARSLGHERFILVAHDWGGAVAWALAINHPECVEKLIIVNSPHPAVFARELAENPVQQKASQYMLAFRSRKTEAMLSANNYAALVGIVMGEGLKKGHFTEEDREAYIAAWSQPGALTGGLNYYRASRVGPPSGDEQARTFEPGARSMEVRVPTLMIWGEQDVALTPGNLEGLDTYVPDLTIRRIPDGTHWVVHEQPALVNGTIREFIARQ
jgi:Predicted hydrolases or acyltransferases (alpha/beta hydrolase superfamily)